MSLSVTPPLRLAITGGRGRLASLLADHFRAPAHEVALFSRTGGPGFRPAAELPGALAASDVLLHLAWSTLPATSGTDGDVQTRQDLAALDGILTALTALPAARRPHLVFFSSGGAVYGNAPGRPNRETDPCQPVGAYGRAKRAAEELIEARAARQGLAATILRISNPYGYPVPKNRLQGIIPHAMRCAVENQPLTLWGDGQARKDFLYYTDFLSAVEQVVAARPAGTYNLAAGRSHSVREVIGLIEQQTGRKVTLDTQPAPAWDVQDSRLDNARICAATGWAPQVALAEGIRRAAAGYAAP